MILQHINNIAEICWQKGIRNVVLSPGSRSAPLTLAFVRHPKIHTYIIPDERSAGFIALGIALITEKPVALVCTSGTAVVNLYPAVAEAFYSQVPLILFTADRPREWIDQADNQTIRQENIFGKHAKGYFPFPVVIAHDNDKWLSERYVSEAVNLAAANPRGPVQVNVPIREPFYPGPDEEFQFEKKPKLIRKIEQSAGLSDEDWNRLSKVWEESDRVLIAGGQSRLDSDLIDPLSEFSAAFKIPVTGDIIANLSHSVKELISCHDLFLMTGDEDILAPLKPNLLITFGNTILSTNLKKLLRTCQPEHHWHIKPSGYFPDTFKSLTDSVPVMPSCFFKRALEKFSGKQKDVSFLERWLSRENKAKKKIADFFPQEKFSELEAVKIIRDHLPDQINLHLANSMPVRLVNFLGRLNPGTEVFANRGTSGIDGCSSTAVGIALHSGKQDVLITGDMAFFYDRNAFWHSYMPDNLRIIILNNHGGGIFRMIDGPSQLPELEEYFETRQPLTAGNTARDLGVDYIKCKSAGQLEDSLKTFFQKNPTAKILEIETDSAVNKIIFDKFKSEFK